MTIKEEHIYPMEAQVYYKVKWYTTKGSFKCCMMSNDKIGQELGGRNKSSISRTISKLIKLGYLEYKQKDPRQLISTDKKFIYRYNDVITDDKVVITDDKVVITDDKTVTSSDKVATLISLLDDKVVIDTMIKSLLTDDKVAYHKKVLKVINYLSKELKIKEDIIIKDNFYFIENQDWKDLFFQWLDYRKKIKKALNEVSYKSAFDKLVSLSENDLTTAKQIVGESIANGWQGLFKLKEEKQKQQKQTSKTQDTKEALLNSLGINNKGEKI